ncbi:unnamed protein product [Lymnaea stagnalis]|uniref:EGF-like domain-containing protein n=1 Tax=Lymnaea stagnalis TaxID=6523 RepID=A0AAV2ICP3_LYMST
MKINLLFVGTVALTFVTLSQVSYIRRDPCRNFDCQNGGACVAPADAPYCLCPPGYTGSQCESKITGEGPWKCPVSFAGGFGWCGEISCLDDADCPIGNKCCSDFCGGLQCTEIDFK